MSRSSAWRGTWKQNRRPVVTMTPDVYVAVQGETTVIGCGECKKKININDYVTAISTEASVDSAPGSGTIQLTVPDHDINDFYDNNQFVIVPMMEVEMYAKGYFLIGGLPQYYKIFWGVVSSVSKSWSNGTTTYNISCKDILRWWELTYTVKNPAFLNSTGTSASGYQPFQNQFAGLNPYTTIIHLAREAMGDFSFTTGSFTSFKPEEGSETEVSLTGSYMKDIMLYWQLKFGRMWNSLVLYGTSGQIHTTEGLGGTVSPIALSEKIFKQEWEYNQDEAEINSLLKLSPAEIATFKVEVPRAGEVEFFENDSMSKLALANQARDQIGYEFFCDPSGDIVFKPPFYNLNVLPNKPVSWVQDFEIIDDSVTDSEAEVFTHITSAGNAFGGATDWGLNDEITTPRTGVYDFHLLRRYGWRRFDYPCEWAGNPKKLFYHLMDMLDRLNAKRQNGTVQIPMRPELRLGFPIWFPKYDSFFYVQGISHAYSVGGQATTTLTLIAKRSKFVAPSNIGIIKEDGTRQVQITEILKEEPGKSGKKDANKKKTQKKGTKTIKTYKTEFPGSSGDTTGLSNIQSQGQPVILRDPKTGKLLGFPNVVMVYRKTVSGTKLNEVIESSGQPVSSAKKSTQKKTTSSGTQNYGQVVFDTFKLIASNNQQSIIERIRLHRYEAAASNAGVYDYAHDVGRNFKEFQIVPMRSVTQNAGSNDENTSFSSDTISKTKAEEKKKKLDAAVADIEKKLSASKKSISDKEKEIAKAQKALEEANKKNPGGVPAAEEKLKLLKSESDSLKASNLILQSDLSVAKTKRSNNQTVPDLNMIIRPVSDEFGFEVIGHYKYGRGAYIDRGKLQTYGSNPSKAKESQNQIINQINIQFSPTGGLLTESVQTDEKSSVDFSAAFEKMRPDDWNTGACFKGVSANGTDKPKDFLMTDVNVYVSDIQKNKGKSVYVEADQTRNARTLAEMKPTVDTGLSQFNAVDECQCGLGRNDWVSILPVSVIRQIMTSSGKTESISVPGVSSTSLSPSSSGSGYSKSVKSVEGSSDSPLSANTNVIVGGFDSGSFFKRLNEFLKSEFGKNIKANNVRESVYSGESLGRTNPFASNSSAGQTNTLTPPGGSLFNRAAQGDQKSIDLLKNQANFNFGQTLRASEAVTSQYKAGSNLEFRKNDFSFSVTSGDPNARPQPPLANPSFNDLVNDRSSMARNYTTPAIYDTSIKEPFGTPSPPASGGVPNV